MQLYQYQEKGVEFLVGNTLNGKGALLADGCGTGKTAQACSALSQLFETNKKRFFPIVILAPASTLYHWKKELTNCGFSGRGQVVHASNKSPEHDVLSLDVLITTARGWTDAAFWHDARNLRGLIIDEASCLKNPQAHLVKVVHSCSDFLQVRWALTATPSQNTLLELKQIFDFIEPGLLGDDASFAEEISDTVRRGTKSTSTPPEIAAANSRSQILFKLIKPFFMRRASSFAVKAKADVILWTKMQPEQQKLYDRVSAAETKSQFGNQHALFSVINGSHEELPAGCNIGKEMAVRRLIKQFTAGDGRMAVFFKYKTLLMRTAAALTTAGIEFVVITGETNAKARQLTIDAMNNPKGTATVLLATSRSCGFGVNLFLVSTIVILEASWNASVDEQAASRASRPGSIHSVTVYRVLTSNSIEEDVYDKALQKTTQSGLLLGDRQVDDGGGVEAVDLATSLFGSEFSIRSHSANVLAMSSVFEKDRVVAAKRFDERKAAAQKKRLACLRANAKVPKLSRKIRNYILGKGNTQSEVLVARFAPLCAKYGFSRDQFRTALRNAAFLEKGVWCAKAQS